MLFLKHGIIFKYLPTNMKNLNPHICLNI
ncbi:hypothetical protein DOY81_009967 [Sarcophaga bullata]|nr:hypothetical protein DOY81_009967 [Sarcophaga bullata]